MDKHFLPRFINLFIFTCVSIATPAQILAKKAKNDKPNSLVGFVDEAGKWVLKPNYVSAVPFSGKGYDNGYTFVETDTYVTTTYNGKQPVKRIIDKKGAIALEKGVPKQIYWNRYVIGEIDEKTFIFDLKDGKYEIMSDHDNHLSPLSSNPAQFTQIMLISRPYNDKKNGILRLADLKIILQPVYPYIHVDKNYPNTILINKDGLYAITDSTAQQTLDFKYTYVDFASYPYLIAHKNKLSGLIDVNQKQILECKYDEMVRQGHDSLLVEIAGKKMTIDFHGNIGHDMGFKPKPGEDGGSGLFAVSSAGLWGYKNASGIWVIEPKYLKAGRFSKSGKAMVRLSTSKYTFINTSGSIASKYMYDDYDEWHDVESMYPLAVKINGLWDFENLATETLHETPNISQARAWDQFGTRPIKINNHWGWVDKLGKMTIEPQFEEVYPFTGDGCAIVWRGTGPGGNDAYGLINREGKTAFPNYGESIFQFMQLSGSNGTYSCVIDRKNYTLTVKTPK